MNPIQMALLEEFPSVPLEPAPVPQPILLQALPAGAPQPLLEDTPENREFYRYLLRVHRQYFGVPSVGREMTAWVEEQWDRVREKKPPSKRRRAR
jgi:hypothetical protein